VVHAAAIAATSLQLDALINGGMEESEKRCAKIEDVRVDDFVRFCEYAYRGDYTVPPWEEVVPESSSSISQKQENNGGTFDFDYAVFSSEKKKKKKGKKEYAISERPPVDVVVPDRSWDSDGFRSVTIPVPQPEVSITSRTALRSKFDTQNFLIDSGPKSLILQHFEPVPNSAPEQNFTPVLLAHARLYCFAHVRFIASLRALTLDKLHKTLLTFKLYSERIGDIVELARYTYSNPYLPDRKDDGTLDDLRKLVVDYIVCEVDTIGKHAEFVKYMEEGGEFVGDFWRLARSYMI
jgi:hypothetical protein